MAMATVPSIFLHVSGPPHLKSTLSTYQQRQDTYGILTPPGFLSLAPDGSDSTLQISFSNLLPDPALNAHYATSMLPTADSPSTAQREINPKFLRPQVSRGKQLPQVKRTCFFFPSVCEESRYPPQVK